MGGEGEGLNWMCRRLALKFLPAVWYVPFPTSIFNFVSGTRDYSAN